jgi:flagellar basal-body rod protein FlgB
MTERALWVAKSGLDAQQTRMAVISNNLANVNTTGFKKSRAIFEDLILQILHHSMILLSLWTRFFQYKHPLEQKLIRILYLK